MTPKERTLAVANRRMPTVLASTFKATPEVDQQLVEHLGLKEVDDLIGALGVCCLHWPWKHISTNSKQYRPGPNGLQYDIWGIGRKEVAYDGGTYMEIAYSPLANAQSAADVHKHPWPNVDEFDFSNVIPDCEHWADTALSITEWGMFETSWQLRGFQNFLIDLALNEDIAQAILDHVEETTWAIINKLWDIAGDRCSFFGAGDDFGTQESLFFSLETFDKFFRPRYKRAFEFAHKRGLKTWLHCDGAVRPLIPRLIDAGLDILDPLMPMIPQMNPYSIIPEFGKDLVFHGTMDVQHLLPFESERKVREEIRRQMDELWPLGGLYMAPSHCIQPGTPIKNILAAYDELNKFA